MPVEGHDMPFSSASDFLQSGGEGKRRNGRHHVRPSHRASSLVGAAHELGLRIPAGLQPDLLQRCFPVARARPLTAVAVSGREMGRIGADLLLHSMLSPARENAATREGARSTRT